MKMVSYPPFIVFFDTIAVILFLLIMNQDQRVTIELPENKLFTGAEIIYKKNSHYFRLSGGEYKPKKKEDNFIYFLECKPRFFECRESKKNNIESFILLPDIVYNDIAKLTLLAFGTKICTSVKYVITEMGQIDYHRLQKDNPCLNKLTGFSDLVSNRSYP